MANANCNREFNNYQQGPGANLGGSHQPGAMANSRYIKSSYRLCLKNVPEGMNSQAIQNLCSPFGKVAGIHTSTKTPYIFVAFETSNDMERVRTGLRDNPHGISVDIAKDTKNPPYSASEKGKDENKNPALSNVNMSLPSQVDMNKRSTKGPFSNPQRPNPFRKQPLHVMHDGDRNNPKQEQSPRRRQMHSGRPYNTEPKEAADQTRRLSESSTGSSYPQKNEYVNQSNVAINGNVLGNCIRCSRPANNVCQRCEDFYCSFECQKKDWQKHRYICFQMPQLVPLHSNNIGVQLPQTTPNLTKASKTQNQNIPDQNKQNPPQIKDDPRGQQIQKPQTITNKANPHPQNQNIPDQIKPNPPQIKYDPRRQQIHKIQAVANKADPHPQNNHNPETTAKGPQQKPQDAAPPKAPEPKPKPTAKGVDLPASGCTVAITSISKSDLVYIRSLAHNDNIEYIKILNIINSHAKNCPVLEKLPECGDILISDFQDTGCYRVRVVDITNKDKILVAYLDFGNLEEKKLSELRELPEEAYTLPRYTIPVQLKGVKDFQTNKEVLSYLNSFVDISGRELKMIYDNIKDGIELIDLSTNVNINKKILDMLKVEVPKDDTPVMSGDVEMRLLPEGENVPVYVLDNSFLQTGCISCIHESDLIKLEGFNKQIQAYAEKTTETYTPREQELCLVKYEEDGVWYRAECLEVGDTDLSVLFIDYGNEILAKIGNIRKCPKEFTHPCLTSTCFILGLPEELNDKAVERLKELIPINEKLVLEKTEHVAESGDINQVNIPKVIDSLEAENLI